MTPIEETIHLRREKLIHGAGCYPVKINVYLGHKQYQLLQQAVHSRPGAYTHRTGFNPASSPMLYNGMEIFRVVADDHFHLSIADI